jgi:hypothetical protein
MKRIVILSLWAIVCATMQAQEKNVRVLARTFGHTGLMKPVPKVFVDERTHEKTIVWPSTENAWIKDSCWATDVPTVEELDFMPPTMRWPSLEGFVPNVWQLTEEGNETVLHCYLLMPADVVTNLWLASEETAIVDEDTGKHYRAKRSVPNCWKKHFSVRASEGTLLDFQIYFPKLPESTQRISIYGVPNWYLRGNEVIILNRSKEGRLPQDYDPVPKLRVPHLVKAEHDYNKDEGDTWPVFNDVHLIKPMPEYTMALWLTPEATYLAMAKQQNWMREYYDVKSGTVLIDAAGNSYALKEVQGLPLNRNFWVEEYSGDYFAWVMVFEPLPLETMTITYIEPDGEPFEAWGAEWDGKTFRNLDVKELRANQPLFKYHKRVIAK